MFCFLCRLRDWAINCDMMLVRELFSAQGMSDESRLIDLESFQPIDEAAAPADDWLSIPPTTPAGSEVSMGEDGIGCSSSEASFRMGNVQQYVPKLGIELKYWLINDFWYYATMHDSGRHMATVACVE